MKNDVQIHADTEGMIRVTPFVILSMVFFSLEILNLAGVFPGHLWMAVLNYSSGLIALDKKQTARGIANYLGGYSHDQLTRMMVSEHWHCSKLMLAMIRLIQMLGIQGHLILDDTILRHPRSKKIEGVYWDWDHAEHRYVLGQRMVLLLWSDGVWRIPVGFAFWHKKGSRSKYRTKNEIARGLLRWAFYHGLKPTYVTFDSWYASRANFHFLISSFQIPFITRIKRNTRLIYKGKKLQARTIGRRLMKQSRAYHIRSLGVFARAAAVQVGEMGMMTFVVVKDDLDGEKSTVKYLLASTPLIGARQVVQGYRSRWTIEVYFRDLKQHLGLQNYQGRSMQGVHHHLCLVFLAGLVLDHFRFTSSFTLGEMKSMTQRLIFMRWQNRFKLVTMEAITKEDIGNLAQAVDILREQFPSLTGLSLPKRLKKRKAG